ncbi:metal-sulfur cluster assembly factor [Candidatus Neomarinimicrobiota bacterium]
MNIQEQVIEALKQCYDPELPVDLWNLGLIYNIDLSDVEAGTRVDITMTLTTPGCGMAGQIAANVKKLVSAIEGVADVHVEKTFDPRWQPAMMTDIAREKLGIGPEAAFEPPPQPAISDRAWE